MPRRRSLQAPDPAAGLLADYSTSEGLYRDYAQRVRDLLERVLATKSIRVHSVTCRVKARDSLAAKIRRTGKDYSALSEITDLAGVRVICYFADDVDRVAALIESEFTVDTDNSIDRRRSLEPDRFCYLSLHHIVSFDDGRAQLPEYHPFRGLKLEIQTRSILQHAWAEIEHDIGYKSSMEVPRHLRRRVMRLAGLLELADQEFFSVRDQIVEYESTLEEKVATNPTAVDLDKPALTVFSIRNKVARKLDSGIAKLCNARLTPKTSVDYALTRLNWLGHRDLGSIEQSLKINADTIMRFASHYLQRSRTPWPMERGMSLFYLAYVLVAQRKSAKQLQRFAIEAMDDSPEDAKYTALRISQVWDAVEKNARTRRRKTRSRGATT